MTKPALLYVHIPFCIHHCRNCTACVLIGDSQAKLDYLDALKAEILATAPALSEYRFPAVYIGGGSPTTLKPDALSQLMKTIRKELPVEPRAEITVEAMPQTIGTPSLDGLATGGATRVSLSMQSAVQSELEALDCGFTANDVQNAVLFLDRFRFNNVNIDLMYGIPEQTPRSLETTLRILRNFNPAHVSLYPFNGGTDQSELLSHAVEILSEYGYQRYSQFHFAQHGRECNYWNMKYRGMEYVGLGLGARSLIDGFTYTNTTDWETYRDHSSEFERIATDIAKLSEEDMRHYLSASKALLTT